MSETWTDEAAQAWASAREWKFDSYYKYGFYFTAQADGLTGKASVGGDSGDIYRYQVEPVMAWADVIDGGEWDLLIKNADGDELYCGPA